MPASVHIADLSVRDALPLVFGRGPKPGSWPGLVDGHFLGGAPLSPALVPNPQLTRVCLVAFWDDEASIDRFVESNPVAATLAGGFRARLEPLRIHGRWPGIPDDLPKARTVGHDGQEVVVTIGRTRMLGLPRFLRYAAQAGGAAAEAPGLVWGTAMAAPPYVGTFSVWESSQAIADYAYAVGALHTSAIAAGRVKPFHHTEAFIRFHPYELTGHLDARRNPMAVDWSTTPAGSGPV